LNPVAAFCRRPRAGASRKVCGRSGSCVKWPPFARSKPGVFSCVLDKFLNLKAISLRCEKACSGEAPHESRLVPS
jgi:hypothetical protein